jgi:DNA polymerase-3 subunit alpha
VSTKIINRQALELLILVGAFDDTYGNRASLLASIDQAIEQGELFREFNDQTSLFHDKIELEATYFEMEDLSLMTRLADEKELLGIYVSSHPLSTYRKALSHHGYVTMAQAGKLAGKRHVACAAIVQSVKVIRTKRGDPMAFLTIGDETDDMQAVVFPDVYRANRTLLEEESLLFIKGKIESRNDRIQWIIAEMDQFDEAKIRVEKKQRLFIKLSERNSEESLKKVKETANTFPGNTPIIIHAVETRQTYQLSKAYHINPAADCIHKLRAYFGEENVVLEKI